VKHAGTERFDVCNCRLRRTTEYAKQTREGRAGATKHHFVAERFFGRSGNRKGTVTAPIFTICPWDCEGQNLVLCYECHEELIHNPVLLPGDFALLRRLVFAKGLDEDEKPDDRSKIGARINLFHEVIASGLRQLVNDVK